MARSTTAGNNHSLPTEPTPGAAWFCLRTQCKHEHIAAGHIRQMEGVEVFNPRVRFPRPTRTKTVWITEAMFPNYLFARFDWKSTLNRVQYAPGIHGVVHFGTRWPTIPESVITELRTLVGQEEICTVSKDLAPGETVEIIGGAFHGLEAVVTRVMPSRQRVALLLDFLGRQTAMEVPVLRVVRR
jgi:transcriptional antiterminator RfaH